MMSVYSSTVQTARSYYNSKNADNFYFKVWGGEFIHVGIYEKPGESIAVASQRTIEKIVSCLKLSADSKVLEIGSGYGGSARYLARTFGCTVDCLNLSEVHNDRNRAFNREQALEHKVKVIDGNFEEMPFADAQYDIVSSQDALLHSGDKESVLKEAFRVLKSGGEFIFVDLMQTENCPEGALKPILDRIMLDSMASMEYYQATAEKVGFETVQVLDLTPNLVEHYRRVLEEIEANYGEMLEICDQDYIDKMRVGLQHWVDGGNNGYLSWGILQFRKP